MAQPKKRKSAKTLRRPFGPEYCAETLKLAEPIGVTGAAKQLGVHTSQIYTWRIKPKQTKVRQLQKKLCWWKMQN